MEVDLVLALVVAGTMLGIVEGLKPGPLMTMVVRETLSGGLKAGMWTAAAPIFTDGPLSILLSVLVAASVANSPYLLLAITVASSSSPRWASIASPSIRRTSMANPARLLARSFVVSSPTC